MRNDLLRRLPVEQTTPQDYGGGRHRLRVVYRRRDLVILGLGVMIGAGIFRIAGVQAATMAGPAVIVSFVIAGVVCLLAALCFAELSSAVPVAGSAYSFGYVAFGELWAWFIGWALILELLLAASVVARAWSLITAQTLHDFGVGVPSWLAGVIGQERGFDMLALGILMLLIGVLATGGRLGLRTLWFMVLAKLIVIGLVIAGGLRFFDAGNLRPFVPDERPAGAGGGQTVLDALLGGTPQAFGVWGILAAAPPIVFAYIGFDLIATSAEETEDAPRNVPRGMLASLGIAIVLYLGVAVALVGMISYRELDPARAPLAQAFTEVGGESMGRVIDIGAVLGLTTVILVLLVSLTRVVFSMARDGLLPSGLATIGRYQVPSRATLVAGGAAIVLSQTVNVLTLEQMVVIGTLFAFLAVSAAVPALRRARPDLERPFRVRGGLTVPLLAIVAIGWLMLNLQVRTWSYFGLWMLGGLLLYLAYGRRHSRLRQYHDRQPPAAPQPAPPPDRSPFNVPPVTPRVGGRPYGREQHRSGSGTHSGPQPYLQGKARPHVPGGPPAGHGDQPYPEHGDRRHSQQAAPPYSQGGPGHYSRGETGTYSQNTGQPRPRREDPQGYRPWGPRPYIQGGAVPYPEEWTPQPQRPDEDRPSTGEDPDERWHGGHHRR
ncbi:basic amino acid/polyamine antiporter, APA family [Thermomonospora echinospora]|uniref:Basic amino acid/polyamine antiporter, APA family n=1 Tax=Thermomonospora echinospora TaxID=1992 RepID=A0A1H6BDW9_9ACTN|nr:amino acid permease [Thermomonospora echinospora]SEG58744.1 basic amino acid/polyamine antiporter, APA family [Thermomonospora echinospora]